MNRFDVVGVHHGYGSVEVLRDVNLTIAAGEIVCLLGASGSGKSTLLRIIAGLEPLQAGRLLLDDEPFADAGANVQPEARRFGLVFQDHVLFPHLSIADNVGFGLADLAAGVRAERVAAQLAKVGLQEFADRYPHTLSGGQQQRVALARALAPQPRLMLLDEPFASVDATLRRRLREDTRRLLKDSDVPAFVVTHDAEEAMELADRIAVIEAGRIVQDDSPSAVWSQPASRFIAELFGGGTAIAGSVTDAGGVATDFGEITPAQLHQPHELEPGSRCSVMARPHTLTVTPDRDGCARVLDVRFLGDHHTLLIEALPSSDSRQQRLRINLLEPGDLAPGDRVTVAFANQSVMVYNRE